MNPMMAAGAAATSAVLGTQVDIAPPDTRVMTSLDDALDGHEGRRTSRAACSPSSAGPAG